MWTGTVSFRELLDESRWTVELFDETLPATSAAFPLVSLKDLVTERREFVDPQASQTEQFNYLGLENVESLTGDLVGFRPKLGEEIKSRSKVFYAGDILYGRLRPNLNKVYIAEGSVEEGVCSQEFLVLIPKQEEISAHLLRSLLASKYVHGFVSRHLTGSALPRLSIQGLLGLKIPLPPLEIQAKLEQFIVQEDERRRYLAAELAKLPNKMMDTVIGVLESGQFSDLQEQSRLSKRI